MGAIGKLTLTPKVKSKKDQLVFRMSKKSTKKARKRKNYVFEEGFVSFVLFLYKKTVLFMKLYICKGMYLSVPKLPLKICPGRNFKIVFLELTS